MKPRRTESTHQASLGAWSALLGLSTLLLLAGCDAPPQNDYRPTLATERANAPQEREYLFSVHPLHNPTRLYEVFGPLMDYLSAQVPNAHFRLEAARNYAAYDERLYAGGPDFSLPNPYEAVRALDHGYVIFGKVADDADFHGIILTRRDSGIRTVSDLKGKAVSYPAPTALAATMLPQHYLQTHGLDVMHDVETRYVGSQESSIMNVYLGDVAAGATWPPPWRALLKERPELADSLEVKWETESLPNIALVAREDVPEDVLRQVAQLMFTLHENPEGRAILERMELPRFEPADSATYEPVREFIRRFEAEVRPVE